MPWPLSILREDPVPIAQKAGWALGPVWTGAENLAPSGFNPQTVHPVASIQNELPAPKIPMTPPGINPVTFQFVAQCLNHCTTACPKVMN
jgi:hypothetical protein